MINSIKESIDNKKERIVIKRVRKHIQTTQTNTKFKHMNASAKPDKQENVEK